MNNTSFFISTDQKDASLENVAVRIFQLLGISDWEERDSTNYPPNNHYFAGYAQNACVKVYDYDSDQTPDYPLRISLEQPSWRVGTELIETDPKKIATLLASGGFTVFVPHRDWNLENWERDGDTYIPKDHQS